jgi:hypothetical protein
LFTDPAVTGDRGDQNTRRGLKTDVKTWAEWLAVRERSGLDVARITDWQVAAGEARCRADLTRTNPAGKCKQWIREFVWLAQKHLVVLDIIETARPEISRQWQLHSATVPEIGDRLVTIVNRPPAKPWAVPALQPKGAEGRLFCRTLAPREYTLLLHSAGKAEAFSATGQSLGPTAGNAYHLKYGQNVVEIDPGQKSARTVFLHVLTAVDGRETTPPAASYRISRPGRIEVAVDGATTTLAVPEWFTER